MQCLNFDPDALLAEFLAVLERVEAFVGYQQSTLEFLRAFEQKNPDLIKRWGEQRIACRSLLDENSFERPWLCQTETTRDILKMQVDVNEAAHQVLLACIEWESAFREKNSALISRWYNEFEARRQNFELLVERVRRACQ